LMSELAPGLLIAAPPLGDPNFERSVVLLAAHGPDGAFGWVLNGKAVMSVSELLVRAEVTERRVELPGMGRLGGPVSQDQIWLVSELAPGLLSAAPPLGDPNFERSVVLLAAHGPDGAFGWVLNGKAVMSVSELLVRAEVTERRVELPGMVRFGGPVSQDQIWL